MFDVPGVFWGASCLQGLRVAPWQQAATLQGRGCAGGRLVFMLEGGYDLKALGESVAETFRGLLSQVT